MKIKLELEKEDLVPIELALTDYLTRLRDARPAGRIFAPGSGVDHVMRVLNRVTNLLNGNDPEYSLDRISVGGWTRGS